MPRVGGNNFESFIPYRNLIKRVGAAVRGEDEVAFWDPGRLVRGVLNYKIRQPRSIADIPALVTSAAEVAIDIHTGQLTADRFEAFRAEVQELPGLMSSRLDQGRDNISEDASDPLHSQRTARELRRQTSGDSVLFIALGNGGLSAGMLAYIYYKGKKRGNDSSFYPVRYSRTKKRDGRPRLRPEEIDHLQQLAEASSDVVVFDEDISSGRTLIKATEFFDRLLGMDTIPAANIPEEKGPPVGFAKLKAVAEETE